MIYKIESEPQYDRFGSAPLGNASNAGIYYNDKRKSWVTNIGGNHDISKEEAIAIGKRICNLLVEGAKIIKNFGEPITGDDYEKLYNELENAETKHDLKNFFTKIWILKYYHMMFPNIFPTFYNEDWQRFILCTLKIMPRESKFSCMGQINLFVKKCGISNVMFFHIIRETFVEIKKFYRIDAGENGEFLKAWIDTDKENYVSIGWNKLGDLKKNFYKSEKELLSDKIQNDLMQKYELDSKTSSRKSKEINTFYSEYPENTYIAAMSGEKIFAIGYLSSKYYYEENYNENGAHRRHVKWIKIFKEPKILPIKEGEQTTFYRFSENENLIYLYSLVNDNKIKIDKEINENNQIKEKYVGYKSKFPRNRIIFGAPGTGKSYTLNEERKELLGDVNETNYERVTFHPDYTYANFVGTYKPVPCKDNNGNDAITYKYVPGPFMRIYVKALKNSRTDNVQPFLLIIEEINRAKVSAVFGDVFQLLDRDDNEVSEYPIEASEDIKKYLVEQLGGKISDYEKIYIPDNMFIWATMNSADQGVFPMDTAFKRRWDFTYIGINENEENIKNKYVVLGKGDNERRIEWNELRKAINDKLSSFNINEDKLIGPYFIYKNVIEADENNNIDANTFISTFKGKVLMYLFDDAAKQKRESLFAKDIDTKKYSSICEAFDEKGVFVFCSEISNQFSKNIDEEEDN
jgi:hypothetical protein